MTSEAKPCPGLGVERASICGAGGSRMDEAESLAEAL